MEKSAQLKQQALMLKAAYEEAWLRCYSYYEHLIDEEGFPDTEVYMGKAWKNSTAKQMHDQLLMEAQGGINVQS